MKETKLYAKLRPKLDEWGETDRVENALGSGMSDIFYNIDGACGWIETKVAKGNLLYFEKFQPNWMRKHVREGMSRVFVISINDPEEIFVWRASNILKATFTPYRKWLTVDLLQCPIPDMIMSKPYRRWGELRNLLIS